MKRALAAGTAALAGVLLAAVAFAGDDVTSLSYISYLERYATLQPAHGGENLDVVVNMPVLAGDRLDTSRGARLEVQLADGSALWLDEFSTLDLDSIALSRDDNSTRTALYLAEGGAALEIPATAAGDGSLRLDSPAGTVYLNRPGFYRLDLTGGQMRVQAYSGLAELPAGVGSALLRTGQEAAFGQEGGEVQPTLISDRADDFWNWVQERRRIPSGQTAEYVDARDASRAAVLDAYGDWVYVPTFSSWMWRPRVNAGWVPYSYGRWYWTPVGWSWISYEPWGWYPSHYGSWYLDAGFGWVWGWDSVWGPAWVDWLYTPGYVGWCARGYYDWWYARNCATCWGGGSRQPGRWSQVAFDFSGRVRLGQIDPRPWTFVNTGQFGSTHIDRVRIDPTRFVREGPADREGFVRSGPLVTPISGRTNPERSFDSFFRTTGANREVPDLSAVLRREPTTGVRSAVPLPTVRQLRTADLTSTWRRELPGSPGGVGANPGIDRGDARATAGGRIGSGAVPGRDVADPSGVPRGRLNTETANPPVVRREVVQREVVRRNDAAPAPREAPRAVRPESSPRGGEQPRVERPAPPPKTRNVAGSRLWQDDRRVAAGASTDRWAAARVAASRRDPTVRSEVRSYAPAPGWQPRTVQSTRAIDTRPASRSYSVQRAPAAPARSFAPRASAPRSSAAPAQRGGGGRIRR